MEYHGRDCWHWYFPPFLLERNTPIEFNLLSMPLSVGILPLKCHVTLCLPSRHPINCPCGRGRNVTRNSFENEMECEKREWILLKIYSEAWCCYGIHSQDDKEGFKFFFKGKFHDEMLETDSSHITWRVEKSASSLDWWILSPWMRRMKSLSLLEG